MTEQHAVERNALIHPCTVATTTYQTLSRVAQASPGSSDVTFIDMSGETKPGTNSVLVMFSTRRDSEEPYSCPGK